jgi:type I restriction-modification system DNA methylase subunit
VEKPIEDTYVTELVSVIKEIGRATGFDAEFNWKTPSGKPDIKLYYKGKAVAVIEVKRPRIPLSDPKLNEQALKYGEWYRKNQGVNFYGMHNMKYLKLSRYVTGEKRQKTLSDFIGEKRVGWVSVSDFPFKIMPWAKSIEEYKQISMSRQAKKNLEQFILRFKEILQGKTLDLSKDVIETVRRHIEEGASKGLTKLIYLYKSKEKSVNELFEEWRKERGVKKPKNDNQLREFLTLMLKEQLYTFSMKVLFYLVLQSIDAEMGAKLKEDLASIEPSDSEIFKKIFDILFRYAIERSGDFEEVFGTNTVDKLPFMDATLPSLKELISYLNQVRWSETNIDIIGSIFEGLIYTERRHLLGQHYTDTMVVDLILAATLRKTDKLIDPACGSGTFLVRALNYWRVNYGSSSKNYELVEGIDIDKLASMLSKMNLYIQALEEIKEKIKYYPKIIRNDFFKAKLLPDYSYITTNPPYTRQEEMVMAFYDKDYKKNLTKAVEGITDWSKRASIYAYFLVGGAKLLKQGGRLGFVVENSWLNAEYGGPLKDWFLRNFTIEYVIESLIERWFEDAKVITNIIIAEKSKSVDYVTKFIYLKRRLRELFGAPPPASDFVANQRYYEKISELLSGTKKSWLKL